MPALANGRHELFAQGIAKGETADQAYENAGYAPNRGNAARLKAKDDIMKRVTEIQGIAVKQTVVSIKTIADQLDEDRALAHKVEQPGAAVSASVAKGKLYGLMPDKHELTGANGGPIEHRDKTPEAVRDAINELFGGSAAKPA